MSDQTMQNCQRCQVHTPEEIIRVFWRLVKSHRPVLTRVIDMGAGDGRFALYGHYSKYDGVEIDSRWGKHKNLPKKTSLYRGCVFDFQGESYEACIGNPPYVRHHEIDNIWRRKVLGRIRSELAIVLSEQSNLFVYFMCLGIMKTKRDGLMALIIPYEWVSRPSVKALREYIKKQGWSVHVYRFRDDIFRGVLTTASVTIINKAATSSDWHFYDIDSNFTVKSRKGITGSRKKVLPYENRGSIWSLRGLSPGTQKVFTLTDGERIHFGLRNDDVIPCTTSLRTVPRRIETLDKVAFEKYFASAGQKCWLIRADLPWDEMSNALQSYLLHIPEEMRNTSTCMNREPWYQYKPYPAPRILYSSGFTSFGPKFLLNRIGARAVGSVHGVHSSTRLRTENLLKYLKSINFEKQIVSHSGSLKKVEVKQMNGVLNNYRHGR